MVNREIRLSWHIYLWCKLVQTSIGQYTRQCVNGAHTRQWHTRLLSFTFTECVCTRFEKKRLQLLHAESMLAFKEWQESSLKRFILNFYCFYLCILMPWLARVVLKRLTRQVVILLSILYFHSFFRCTSIFALIWYIRWGLTQMTCFGIITCIFMYTCICTP